MIDRLVGWFWDSPPWLRWTVGVLVLLVGAVFIMAWRLVFAGPSAEQAVAAAEAGHAAEDAQEAAQDAAVASDRAQAALEALDAQMASQPAQDAQDDASAEDVVGEVVGDGTKDLGGGVRGGSLDDL